MWPFQKVTFLFSLSKETLRGKQPQNLEKGFLIWNEVLHPKVWEHLNEGSSNTGYSGAQESGAWEREEGSSPSEWWYQSNSTK